MIPFVSIVIPFKDRQELLFETLDSVLTQTFKNFEIILVDDHSQNDFKELLAEKLKNVFWKYFRNSSTLGPGSSRQKGFEESLGKYVLYLDSDDLLHSQMLEKTVSYMETHPDFGMCYVISGEFRHKNEIQEKAILKIRKRSGVYIHKNIIFEILKNRRIWDTSACLWRKSCIEKFEPWTSTRFEDYAYEAQIEALGMKIGHVPEMLCYFRVTPGSISNHADSVYHHRMAMFLHVSNYLTETPFVKRSYKAKLEKYILFSFFKLRYRFGDHENLYPSEVKNFFLKFFVKNEIFKNKFTMRILILLLNRISETHDSK